MSTINLEIGDDAVAVIGIDVPGRSMNVLTPELIDELDRTIARVAEDPAIKGAVLLSKKSTGFIAGADLKELVDVYGRETALQGAERSQRLTKILRRMETCGKPFVAAINGLALGGGLEVCLACHRRFLSDSQKAVLGLPEVKVGLLPGAGGTQRLPRLVGIARALPLILEGTFVAPAQSLSMGLVDAVLPSDQLLDAARAWVLANPDAVQPWDIKGFKVPGGVGCTGAAAIESFQLGTARIMRRTRRNYPAPLAILSAVFEGTIVPIDVGLRIESKYFGKLLAGPVARNLMRTMFINKGAADRLERRPPDVPKLDVRKLGVIGAGMMGAGIAHCAATTGIEVILLDATQELADRGKNYCVGVLDKAVQRGDLDAARAQGQLDRITPTTDYERLKGCQLIVEAVFEDRAVKADVTQKVSHVVGEEVIFASNTSTLPITGLARAWPRADRFIGLHFFSPVDRMPLVEIILGKKTSEATLACSLDFVAQLRKTPIVVNDSPGFFTSRVFGTFVDEGMTMLIEGVAPTLVDNVARLAGMPTGPLAISDEVNIKLLKKVHEQAVADDLPDRFRRLASLPVVNKMIELGRTGRKDGAGFFDYTGPEKTLWSGLSAHFPVAPQQPGADELRDRFLFIQAMESARCLEEGIIAHPADADLGSILGIGFPTWTGGTLSYIETVGIARFVARCDELADRYGERFRPSAWLRKRAAGNEGMYASDGVVL